MAGYSVTYSVVDEATAKIEAINRRIRQMREPIERQARAIKQFVDVSGLSKVAEGFTSIARSTLGAFESMSRLVPVMGALTGAASIAGIVKLTDSFAKLGNELKVSADRIGIAPQSLQVLQDATIKAGGNVNDMTQSLMSLADTSAGAFTGRNTDAAAWFNRAGIAIRDSNGHLKTANQLLPDVLKYLDGIKNPADRMTAAMGLGGDALFRLDESFRTSGRSVNEWIDDAKKLTPLSNEQLTIFQRYKEAQGNVTTAVQHLGEQISATLATHFTPLINHLAEFVNKHSPDIVAAVDRIATKFANWLDNIKWDQVEQGVNKVLDALKWVTDHLDAIKTAAEIFFGLWVASKFAPIITNFTNLVGSIASVHSKLRETPDATKAAASAFGDLGSIGGGKADSGGSGLLGKLASMVNVITLAKLGIEEYQRVVGKPLEWQGIPENSPLRQHLSEAGQQAAANAPPETKPFSLTAPSTWGGQHGAWWNPGSWLGGKEMPQENKHKAAAIRDRLATDFNLSKEQASGIVGNLQAESGLAAVQEKAPTSGRGGFGWAQWTGPRRQQFEQYARDRGLDPKSDEANYGFLAEELHSQQYAGAIEKVRQTTSAQESARVFEATYEKPAVSNAGVRGQYASAIAGLPSAPTAQGAPLQVTGGPPVSGAVDITVTHKNPPPGATVTAAGTGDVSVGKPRTEQQAFAWT